MASNTIVKDDIDSDDEGLCIICFERERETFIEPCGHIVACEECSHKLSKESNINIREKCILCRQSIRSVSYIKSNKIVNVDP